MDNKEVKNEDIKEEEKDKKNNPPKKWKKFLIIGIIVLIIIAIGIGIWYLLLQNKNSYKMVKYVSKEIVKDITVYYDENNHPVKVKNDLGFCIINNYNKSVLSGDKCWYLISDYYKEIISFYENNDVKNVDYIKNYSDEYFMVYFEDNNNKNIALIVNEQGKTIFEYKDNYPKIPLKEEIKEALYDKKNKTIYLYTDKTAMVLNENVGISKQYSSIIHYLPNKNQYGFKNSGKIVAQKNNNYYIVDLYNSLNEVLTNAYFLFELGDEYILEIYEYNNRKYLNCNYKVREINDFIIPDGDDKNLVIYKINNDYYVYTNGITDYYEEYKIDIVDDKDDKYINYMWSVASCCGDYNIIVNKHTNKIVTSDVNYIKVANGYYFVTKLCANDEGSEYYYTEDLKELGAGFVNAIDEDENIYVHDDNYIYKYDVRGNELFKSQKYEYINNGIIINKTLYFLAKENNNLYLINLNSGDKIEIAHDIQDSWNLAGNISYKDNTITIEEFRYSDGSIYEYNLTTKTVTKVH